MTDQELIAQLLAKNNITTYKFFYVDCKPLFCKIIRYVFNYNVDVDEFVSEFYLYLMSDDGKKLKGFQYKCSLKSWIKVVATRYFIEKHDLMIDNTSREPLYIKDEEDESNPTFCPADTQSAVIDVERVLASMKNQRYALVIRKLVIEDVDPEELAQSLGVRIDNLYNIKKRALKALAGAVAKDKTTYEKGRY